VIGAHPSLNADIRRRQSDSEATGGPGLESMQHYQGDIVAVHGGDSRGNMRFCMLPAARRELADRFLFARLRLPIVREKQTDNLARPNISRIPRQSVLPRVSPQ
jgi:hypothetical protein